MFPLLSRCGRIANIVEETQITNKKSIVVNLEEFPGQSDAFLAIVKFCYGSRVELTPRNVVMVYCAADYLEMTDDYGEDNLLPKSESFFHKHVLQNWKDCILALQSCEPVISRAEKLNIVGRCLNALSVMVCTDTTLFGWPMMMYGSLQSPGGSILWNGINTGARIHSIESDWWFEDISYLNVELFERLIQSMEARGIRPENLSGAIMYYCKKYIPGLGRRQGGQIGISRSVASFSMTPAAVDQRVLLESVVKLLPEKKGKSFCRFLLPLRVILQVLFFEQMQLRRALAGCLNDLDTESAPAASLAAPNEITGQTVQRDGWVTVVRENQVLKVDMERMRTRVGELEQEFTKIKEEVKKVTKSHSYLSSPRFVTRRIGCKLLPRSSDTEPDVVDSTAPTPRASIEQAETSARHSRHRKSFSLF
ncbi:Hypothetical predicted protein [Olea europaea subsp. europaea]|uniref:NPH3 domain-containing protein n=1 Tax=Olea europaea subsp. europaea TaxID=158383 RepID=A0A8S0QL97_OLEEU|nr:Hypothetical predicted protein [Olea europaea subsp. europaea]